MLKNDLKKDNCTKKKRRNFHSGFTSTFNVTKTLFEQQSSYISFTSINARKYIKKNYLCEFMQTLKMFKKICSLSILILFLNLYYLVSGEDQLKDKKIVIVGAGIAGIAAAKTLLQNGFESIQILEAQDYYGGRILTVIEDEHQKLELGAEMYVLNVK